SANANVYSAQWGTSGSNVIRALQAKLGLPQDGNLGPATVRALQAHLGTTQDGQISPRSNAVKAMQHALNNGTF
ncbi:MAG: peptidoglycan-binding protein, partial [Tetragenococcus halophilus]|nr:peptidoglycan-binding protein [Tetragenococcus halophilus]